MIASQINRVTVDQNNRLQRIDVVRSLRRQGLPMAQICTQQKNYHFSIDYHRPKQSSKTTYQILIILVIVFCALYLGFDFFNGIQKIEHRNIGVAQIWQQYRNQLKQQGIVHLKALRSRIGPIQTEQWEKFIDQLTAYIDCKNQNYTNEKCLDFSRSLDL